MKRVLTTPISEAEIRSLRIGDVFYLTGHIVTCRDVAHRRLVELGMPLPVSVEGGAILHAGPIVRKLDDGRFEMVSVGPTTSMRMEKFEYDFVKATGVRIIAGKGGMGENTERACQEFGAVHCIFPAGCAVLAATEVAEIERVEWMDLGMPESLWVSRIEEFGPLIVSIDSEGNNLFEENKKQFNEKKEAEFQRLSQLVRFIK